MRRMVSLFAVTAMMAPTLIVASPVFAAGAQKVSFCESDVTLPTTGVTGTLCEREVFTPSGNANQQQHFEPDARTQGKVFEGGAMQDRIIEPSEQSSHIVFTPSGNAIVHNNFR